MNILKTSAQWMWDHKGNNIWWRYPVLTNSNPDTTAPNLNLVEAMSVFKTLEEENLIYPIQHPIDKQTAYLLNEMKEKEWDTFLKNINPFYIYLLRPLKNLFKNLWIFIIWLISLIITGTVGAFLSETIKQLFN